MIERIPKIGEDFVSWCIKNHRENLLEEWDYELNSDDPRMYFPHSEKEVMWKCTQFKHSYSGQIAFRTKTKPTACCYCSSKRILKGFNDLGSLPIAKEYSSNNVKNAEEYFRTSHSKVLWICPVCNKEYKASIADRVVKASGCQFCGGRLPVHGENDLVTWCHINNKDYLLKEWNYHLNEKDPSEYTYGSNLSVHWTCCECGYAYKKQIDQRTLRDFGCKKCNIQGTSYPEQFLRYLLNKVIGKCVNRDKTYGFEIDILIPSLKLGIEYNGEYYHSSVTTQTRDLWKKRECEKHGITLLSICNQYSELIELETTIIWKYSRKIEQLSELANKVIKWINDKFSVSYTIDSEEIKSIASIARDYTYGKAKKNSLEAKFPETAKEWCYRLNSGISPRQVSYGQRDKFIWVCTSCGNEWEAAVSDRCRGHGCPVCSKKRQVESWVQGRVEKYNFRDWCIDNNKTYLLLDWDYDENTKGPEQYPHGSNDSVYWVHNITGHKWNAQISNRRNSDNKCQCKECTIKRRGDSTRKRRLESGENSFLNWCKDNDRMELLEEWDYDLNELSATEYSKKSPKTVWWICSVCGERFDAKIKTRVMSKKKIGVCRHRKRRSEL